jgi:hypothetical protein
MRRDRTNIVWFGNTYFYKDEIFVAMCVIGIALIGMLCVHIGRKMDAEVDRQRQIEMTEIAHDKLVNKEVTK